MTTPVDDNQERVIEEAAREFVDARWQGEEPDVDEFVRQYPQLERQLRQRIQDIRQIDVLFDSLVQTDESDFAEAVSEPDLVGRTIGNFEMVEIIGRGGMGVVYLARDTKLKRSVAVKSMPTNLAGDSTAQMRFRREAELLASLNHPNIAVIYDIIEQDEGAGYLILEYVPGETLAERIAREPIELKEALSMGQQVAGAISAAHKKGIIHRDLKPGNIKITPDGQIKVLDFGLAKATVGEGKLVETTVTQRGRVIGTPAYMSPEQARGKDADHRTDIWSFGCIMYQMLTAHLPFEGETATDTLARIIEREPDWKLLPEETPPNIRMLLHRCLEKDPNKRLDNITEATVQISATLSKPVPAPAPAVSPKLRKVMWMVSATIIIVLLAVTLRFLLEKQTQSSLKEIRLVVLPFDTIGATEEYFAAGMTDEITTRLGYIRGLAVISRNSAIAFKKMGIEIAKESDKFDYFIEGTVQCEKPSDPNSQVKIGISLINADDSTLVWQETYPAYMSNIFDVQTGIAEQVAQALDIKLLSPERKALAYGYIGNTEAYTCFLQGHQYSRLNTEEGNARAIEMHEKAIKLEPNYAEAHASLSNALTNMYHVYGGNRELLPRAKEAAERAIELAPDLPAGHVVLARYYFQGCYDYENALKQFSIALRTHPNHEHAFAWMGFMQKKMGKFEEALPNLLKAAEIDPLDRRYPRAIADALGFLRRYEEAKDYCDQVIRMDPNSAGAYCQKAWLYLLWQGDTTKARKVVDEALRNNEALASDYWIFDVLVNADIYDRKFEAVRKKLIKRSEDFDTIGWYIPNDLWLAEVYGYMKKEDLEKEHYQLAVDILEKKVEEDTQDHRYHSSLGKAYAGLGREQEAIGEGILGVECLPITKDAEIGPMRLEDLARIYVMLGKYDEAVEIVEDLLSMPSELSVDLLRLNPVWDPLRDHPRFQKLLESDH